MVLLLSLMFDINDNLFQTLLRETRGIYGSSLAGHGGYGGGSGGYPGGKTISIYIY